MKTIGIIGYGAFGMLLKKLIERLAPDIPVHVHSSRFEPDGRTFFSLEDTSRCDALILAVPIAAFESTLSSVLPLIGKETIVIDVSTVKIYTSGVLRRALGNRPYVATHPMFGPESLTKRSGDLTGLRIVITDHTLPTTTFDQLITFLTSAGFNVVQMTSDEHDKHLASTLFLTHYIGQIIHAAGFERTEIDTVSFGYLMDAVESVRHDKKLFEDVYKYNPYCIETILRFEKCEFDVRTSLQHLSDRSDIVRV